MNVNHRYRGILTAILGFGLLLSNAAALADTYMADPAPAEAIKAYSSDKKTYAFVKQGKETVPTGSGDASVDVIYVSTSNEPARPLFKKGTTFETGQKIGRITLSGIGNLVFSPDKTELYFTSAAYAVSDIVLAINLKTSKIRHVIDGNSIQLITSGKWKGNLLIQRHKYDDKGAYDVACAVSPAGKELAEVKRI
jgi:hypothetical protein